MKWKSGILAALLAGSLALTGCSGGEKTYKVGLSVFADHPSLNAATEGFRKALEDAGLNVQFDEQNAQTDTNTAVTIAQNFVNSGVDLIFANATPSAQAAASATEKNSIPVIFTSVTDPVGAKLVETMEKPGGNITGTADMHPDSIPKTIEFISKYFDGKTVGTIYTASEQNSVKQIEVMKEAIKGTGLSLVERTVSSTSEVLQAAESLVGVADVIFIVTDNTVVSGLESVVGVSEENDIPLFVGELDSVERGGFAAFGFDYRDIGYEAGQLAVKILKEGKKPSELPAQYPQNLKLVINKQAAEKMGIEWNSEWDSSAEVINK